VEEVRRLRAWGIEEAETSMPEQQWGMAGFRIEEDDDEFYPELRVCGVEEVGLRGRFGRIFFRFNHTVGLVRSNPYSVIVPILPVSLLSL
jgi:hypothetical protein